jgi:ketosteroid isomerase-like protein
MEISFYPWRHSMRENAISLLVLPVALLMGSHDGFCTESDANIISAIDTEYQAAVERNDWRAMDGILHPNFVLVLGDGTTYSRPQLIASAKDRNIEYEEQAEVPGTQIVRVYGDSTATVTAQLVLKGTYRKDRSRIDFKLWFTDTYVRTKDGWKYAFGQAGTPTPLMPTP